MSVKLVFLMFSVCILKVSCKDSICPSSNICGDHAKCYDKTNGKEYKKYSGPYCRCNTEYYGHPPNCTRVCKDDCKAKQYCDFDTKTCKTGCRSHDDCLKNEICNPDKMCVEGCISNSGCKVNEFCNDIINDKCTKNCEKDALYPIPIFASSMAYNPCGDNGICIAEDHREYCSCADNYFPESSKGCRKRTASDVIPKDPDCTKFCGKNASCEIKDSKVLCYCRSYHRGNPLIECAPWQFLPPPSTALKPGQESEISVACIATLCAG